MLRNFFSYFRRFDWLLILAVFLLVCFGLAAIYSIALSQETANFFNFKKQIAGAIIGFGFLFLAPLIDYKIFRIYNRFFYAAAFLLLAAVLVFGKTIRGTTGWFDFGGLSFQPVELAKLFLIIFLAAYFALQSRGEKSFRQIAVSGVATAALCALVLRQPDLGSAALLFIIWFGLLLLRGISRRHLFILLTIFLIIFLVGWFFILQDYQKDRLLTFIYPERDPLQSGYNVSQSIIAVGSGQLLGRGLGFGSQSQLKFLPASQTDFIFAVLAEELGLLGVIFIFIFWALLFWRLILAAKKARDDFPLFFILGAGLIFLSQFLINVGMNLGVMPVTGVTLPFMSLGSSSLVASLLTIGIVEGIRMRS
ncbi:MAG: rod shape-determining protein RodA [Patescibacteria group bacterium]|nr:rod shape-determining protein RodA [Patescibacteria group bacterium]MDD5490321.1 rod shape-determining protein RodA [Patescibacteria group bacterium]